MNILYFIAYWYTYSKWSILGSLFITHILNIAFKKYWLSPLIINAVSIILLIIGIKMGLIDNKEISYSIINIYLPVVFSSIIMNILITIYKKIKL